MSGKCREREREKDTEKREGKRVVSDIGGVEGVVVMYQVRVVSFDSCNVTKKHIDGISYEKEGREGGR
jgi:hypothetical protein